MYRLHFDLEVIPEKVAAIKQHALCRRLPWKAPHCPQQLQFGFITVGDGHLGGWHGKTPRISPTSFPFFQAGIVYLGDVQCEAWWQPVTSTMGGQLVLFCWGGDSRKPEDNPYEVAVELEWWQDPNILIQSTGLRMEPTNTKRYSQFSLIMFNEARGKSQRKRSCNKLMLIKRFLLKKSGQQWT